LFPTGMENHVTGWPTGGYDRKSVVRRTKPQTKRLPFYRLAPVLR
jgi:hypothetical protein